MKIHRDLIYLSFLLAAFINVSPALGNTLEEHDGVLRFSYDPVVLPGNESMGLAGVGYLFDIGKSGYVGFSGYSAVTGQRGGFFTGGVNVGLKNRFRGKWIFDTGLFVGGGGGGAAPQGGGLMLRPHLSMMYDFNTYRVGLGYSGIFYPNGSISSRQLYLSYERPFTTFLVDSAPGESGISSESWPAKLRLAPTEITTVLRQYNPNPGSLNTSGTPISTPSHLVGVSVRRYRSTVFPRLFNLVEVAGSAGGITDGYAEVLGGMGYQLKLFDSRGFAEGNVAVGAGGGGRVDTGGGIIIRSEVGLGYQFTPALSMRIGTGFMTAIDGNYQASTLNVQLGYRWQFGGTYDYGRPPAGNEKLDIMNWRVRAVSQLYTTPAWKGMKSGNSISLMGVKADMMLSQYTYITGQGLAAYEGGAGGYAVGLLGVGKKCLIGQSNKLSLSTEFAIGAAGGGSVDVGDGVVVQPGIGISFPIGKSLDFDINFSHIKALTGALDSSVYELGISYKFGTPGRRYH